MPHDSFWNISLVLGTLCGRFEDGSVTFTRYEQCRIEIEAFACSMLAITLQPD